MFFFSQLSFLNSEHSLNTCLAADNASFSLTGTDGLERKKDKDLGRFTFWVQRTVLFLGVCVLFVCLLLITERKVTRKPLFYIKGEGCKLHQTQSFSLRAAALPGMLPEGCGHPLQHHTTALRTRPVGSWAIPCAFKAWPFMQIS